ncbi:MAG: polysaccharide biosynthesis protein, partial [Synergistaceae bacterium]|nr:polysaccharide biosynthesis protein [Synergistaceae bacterium]
MYMDGKVILVTGGTGSFGKKFTRTLLETHNPKAVRIFSRGEYLQYQMRQEFDDDLRLRFFIGDVRDRERVYRAMNGVDIVVHAAALKQVPTCEYNPIEAIKTNIDGSANVIDAAIDNGVEKVMAIST